MSGEGWGAIEVPEFTVLGPLGVRVGGRWTRPAPALRGLLTVLLLHNGDAIDADRLFTWISASAPVRRGSFQTAMSRLRTWLGGVGVLLEYTGGGYRLLAPHCGVDVDRFRALSAAADDAPGEEARLVGLAAALALWRGEVAADGPDWVASDPAVAELRQARLSAVRRFGATALAVHRPADALSAVAEACERHLFDEPLHAVHLKLLAAADRPAEALRAYERLQHRLRDELGVAPSHELRLIHQELLARGESPGSRLVPMRPVQLPPDVIDFRGRVAELATLESDLRDGGISAVVGAGGVGKTALALRFAHAVAGRFPDGVLYANLRGWGPGSPTAPARVLARFMGALGLDPDRVPPDPDEAAAQYRSLLAGRRLLILLDDAIDAAQVQPLLPAGRSAVLVTSRDQLAGLAARDGARRLRLDPPAPDDALAIIRAVLGEPRVKADETAAGELVELCSRLPLALRIAAADLAIRPDVPIAAYVNRLRSDGPLSVLEAAGGDDASLRTVFHQSFAAVPLEARRLFRRMGAFPAEDLAPQSLAVLASLPVPRTREALDRLVAANLVEPPVGDRYRVHGLLRGFAREVYESADDSAATRQLMDDWLCRADAAAHRLYPGRLRLREVATVSRSTPFADDRAAVEWLGREGANLWLTASHAAAEGSLDYARRLADALRGYIAMCRDLTDARRALEVVAAACAAATQLTGGCIAELGLAEVMYRLSGMSGAEPHLDNARRLAEEADWPQAQAAAHVTTGGYLAEQLRLGDALRHLTTAVDICRQLGDNSPALHVNLGFTLATLGQLEEAGQQYRLALAIYQAGGQREMEAITRMNLATVERKLDHIDEATSHADRALAVFVDLSHRLGQAEALTVAAMIHHDAGRLDEAMRCIDTAVDVAVECGDKRATAHAELNRGMILIALDRADEALRCFAPALAAPIGQGFLTDPHNLTAIAYLRTGDLHHAHSHARLALDLAARSGSPLLDADASATFGAICQAEGNLTSARRWADAARDTYRRLGHSSGLRWTEALLTAIRYDVRQPGGSTSPSGARQHPPSNGRMTDA